MKKYAQFVKKLSYNPEVDQDLYRVVPPVEYPVLKDEGYKILCTDYVMVSSIENIFNGKETFIFPCDSEGNVLSWLPCSFGMYNHKKALNWMGYIVRKIK